jgi:pantoate--beta-alanine ligase
MGALHAGHTSLISKGKQENGLMVASIFVNPTQFTEQSDLVNYPRTLDNDALLAEKAGCDLLFVPEVSEIYPDAAPKLLNIDFGLLEKYMEGAFRPGHFKGMATVVKRLFDIVQPDRAYFGEKDFQQLAVVRLMVQMLHIPIEIIGCPTIRENDGLAMSSRNIRLSPSEREASIIISKTLTEAQQNKKILSPEAIKVQAINHLKASSLIDVEYFELVDAESLTPVHSWSDSNNVRACVAVRLGNTRLIDNIAL